MKTLRAASFLFLATLGLSMAEPRFAGVFGDHAVLQRDREIVVWGDNAKPDEALTVRFGEVSAKAAIDSAGRWEARLPARSASADGRVLALFSGDRRVVMLRDVVVGEVWLAAGQSNMQFPVRGMVKALPAARDWVSTATLPSVRFRRVNDKVLAESNREAEDVADSGPWQAMTPESVAGFSAVAAVFARAVSERLGVPVGIIDVSWGGKPIEAFIPREAFSPPLLKSIRELAEAGRLEELRQLKGGVVIRNPEGHPGAIFNARMAPLTRYVLRGFLWYQAESNAGRGEDPREYRHKMRGLIEGWRARWRREDLPCFYVQLPGYPPATGWVRVREEQRRALAIADTGMVVTIDIPGEGIHPPDKLTVGQRLAGLALARTYGVDDLVASGPVYSGHRINGSEVHVRFMHATGGLMVGGMNEHRRVREIENVGPGWFELAGEDRSWRSGTARIEGGQVVVTSEAIAKPVAVRYACQPDPQGPKLYNRAGLPASPFCSELDWLPWEDQP